MKFDSGWVGAFGTWASNLLLGISLIFIWYQVRSLKHQIRSSAFQGIWNIWIEIDKFFVMNPDLKPYFYHGKALSDTDTEDKKMRVESAAEMIMDTFANFYHQRHLLVSDDEEAYCRFMHKTYESQPVFKEFVKKNGDWYIPAFVGYLTKNSC